MKWDCTCINVLLLATGTSVPVQKVPVLLKDFLFVTFSPHGTSTSTCKHIDLILLTCFKSVLPLLHLLYCCCVVISIESIDYNWGWQREDFK